jgi:hypothetical protein
MVRPSFPVWRVLAAIALCCVMITVAVGLLNQKSDLAFISGLVLLFGSVFTIARTVVLLIGRRLTR